MLYIMIVRVVKTC